MPWFNGNWIPEFSASSTPGLGQQLGASLSGSQYGASQMGVSQLGGSLGARDYCAPCHRAGHTRSQCTTPNGTDRPHRNRQNGGPCGCKMMEEGSIIAGPPGTQLTPYSMPAQPSPLGRSIADILSRPSPNFNSHAPSHITRADVWADPSIDASFLTEEQADAVAAAFNAKIDAENQEKADRLLRGLGVVPATAPRGTGLTTVPGALTHPGVPTNPLPPPTGAGAATVKEGAAVLTSIITNRSTWLANIGSVTLDGAALQAVLTARGHGTFQSLNHVDMQAHVSPGTMSCSFYILFTRTPITITAPTNTTQLAAALNTLRTHASSTLIERTANDINQPYCFRLPAADTLTTPLYIYTWITLGGTGSVSTSEAPIGNITFSVGAATT